MSDFTTEEGRIEAAKEAGRRVAEFQIADGHEGPQSWDMDGVHNARAFSHLSAAGFTRAGSRLYSQVFVDAYRLTFEDATRDDYTTAPEIIRIHNEGDGWVIDGATNSGRYTQDVFKFDTLEEAAENVPAFIKYLKSLGYTVGE